MSDLTYGGFRVEDRNRVTGKPAHVEMYLFTPKGSPRVVDVDLKLLLRIVGDATRMLSVSIERGDLS